jgi:transcription-repair coupling factor (superfamily II helicase)
MYCQLHGGGGSAVEESAAAVLPEAHVDIGLTAFIPKTYIPADRQRMDVYRRLTRCTDLENVAALQKDMTDAFGEPPRQVMLLLALTEMKLLAGHFGSTR